MNEYSKPIEFNELFRLRDLLKAFFMTTFQNLFKFFRVDFLPL